LEFGTWNLEFLIGARRVIPNLFRNLLAGCTVAGCRGVNLGGVVCNRALACFFYAVRSDDADGLASYARKVDCN